MTLILVLVFFKSICLYLQNIVLLCYDRFLNPKQRYSGGGGGGSSSSGSYCHHHRQRSGNSYSTSSSSALNKARASEREQLLEKIRARKRAAKQRT